jgi:RimJ/RimL family protein N-acetyltransferase
MVNETHRVIDAMTQAQTEKASILRSVPIPITTPRLILRPPQSGDGAELTRAVQETWDSLNQWMPWAADQDTITDAFYESWAREQAALFIRRDNLGLLAFDRDTGRLIGSTGLHRIDWELGNFEIGYWVRQDDQGQGYATEIANALTRYALQALKARTVLISHAEGNDKSRSVIKRLGFTSCGYQPNSTRLPAGDVVHDHFYYRTDLTGLADLEVNWLNSQVAR